MFSRDIEEVVLWSDGKLKSAIETGIRSSILLDGKKRSYFKLLEIYSRDKFVSNKLKEFILNTESNIDSFSEIYNYVVKFNSMYAAYVKFIDKLIIKNEIKVAKEVYIMERLKNTKVLQKAALYYILNGTKYRIGTITKEFLLDRLFKAYVFDIDEKAVNELSKLTDEIHPCFIPGLDLEDYGYYQAFSELPFFISMRVVDRRRPDLQYYLDKYDMKEGYDEFTMFLKTHGRSFDNFYVEEEPIN